MKNLKLNPKAITILAVFCTSISAILVRFSDAPSMITATYRLVWTVVLMVPVVFYKNKQELKSLGARELLTCGASGILLALHFTLWFESLKLTSIASSTVIVCTEALFCALGYKVFFKGKIPKLGIAGMLVAFLGSIIIAAGDGGSQVIQTALYGDLLALLSAAFVAGYTLIGRAARKNMSTSVYTFVVYTACSITLLCMDLMTGTPLLGYGIKEFMIGLGLGVMCTLLGHSVFSWALKYLSPSYVSAAKLCEPVFATVMGIMVFQEMPRLGQIIGGAVILGGVYVYSKVEEPESN